jgi:hypothetical protein
LPVVVVPPQRGRHLDLHTLSRTRLTGLSGCCPANSRGIAARSVTISYFGSAGSRWAPMCAANARLARRAAPGTGGRDRGRSREWR